MTTKKIGNEETKAEPELALDAETVKDLEPSKDSEGIRGGASGSRASGAGGGGSWR